MYQSPSRGQLTLEQMVHEIVDYVSQDSSREYQLLIGTDSHTRDGTHFVTAIIVRRVGKGARYFYRHKYHERIRSLRQKIYYETTTSLEVVQSIRERIAKSFLGHLKIEIHVDVGYAGLTRDLIKEIVGMVVANGYHARIKPDASAASSAADRHTK